MNWIFLIFWQKIQKNYRHTWDESYLKLQIPFPDLRVSVCYLFSSPPCFLWSRALRMSLSHVQCWAHNKTVTTFSELNNLSEWNSSYLDLRLNATSVQKSSLATLPVHTDPIPPSVSLPSFTSRLRNNTDIVVHLYLLTYRILFIYLWLRWIFIAA